MKKAYSIPVDDEPVGIVISRGSKAEPVPMFSAYIWCSVPETSVDENSKAA